MKIRITIISALAFLLAGATNTFGQTGYLLNQQWYSRVNRNPAAAGAMNNDWNAALFYLNQMTGVQDAPYSVMLNADKFYEKMNAGFGFSLTYDKIGVSYNDVGAMLSYAYRLKINEKSSLSFGLAAGLSDISYNPRNNVVDGNFEDDPTLATLQNKNFIRPDFNVGLEYKFQNLTAGFAVDHLLGNKPKDGDDPRMQREFYGYGRYLWKFHSDFALAPQAAWLYANNHLFDFSATAIYRNDYWFGAGYRTSEYLFFMVGGSFSVFRLGYTYSLGLGDISKLSSSTHEIMLTVRF